MAIPRECTVSEELLTHLNTRTILNAHSKDIREVPEEVTSNEISAVDVENLADIVLTRLSKSKLCFNILVLVLDVVRTCLSRLQGDVVIGVVKVIEVVDSVDNSRG